MHYEIWCYKCGKMWFDSDVPDECPHCHNDSIKYDDTYEDKY